MEGKIKVRICLKKEGNKILGILKEIKKDSPLKEIRNKIRVLSHEKNHLNLEYNFLESDNIISSDAEDDYDLSDIIVEKDEKYFLYIQSKLKNEDSAPPNFSNNLKCSNLPPAQSPKQKCKEEIPPINMTPIIPKLDNNDADKDSSKNGEKSEFKLNKVEFQKQSKKDLIKNNNINQQEKKEINPQTEIKISPDLQEVSNTQKDKNNRENKEEGNNKEKEDIDKNGNNNKNESDDKKENNEKKDNNDKNEYKAIISPNQNNQISKENEIVNNEIKEENNMMNSGLENYSKKNEKENVIIQEAKKEFDSQKNRHMDSKNNIKIENEKNNSQEEKEKIEEKKNNIKNNEIISENKINSNENKKQKKK